METVAALKQENRRLFRQAKEQQQNLKQTPSFSGPMNKVSAKEVAALSVEHEMLKSQVDEMKKYLKDNEDKVSAQIGNKVLVEESVSYAHKPTNISTAGNP